MSVGIKMNCCGYEHWFPEAIDVGQLVVNLVDGSSECLHCTNDIPEGFTAWRILPPRTPDYSVGPGVRALRPEYGWGIPAIERERRLDETDFLVMGVRIYTVSQRRDCSIPNGLFDERAIKDFLQSDRGRGTNRLLVTYSQYDWLMQAMNDHIISREPINIRTTTREHEMRMRQIERVVNPPVIINPVDYNLEAGRVTTTWSSVDDVSSPLNVETLRRARRLLERETPRPEAMIPQSAVDLYLQHLERPGRSTNNTFDETIMGAILPAMREIINGQEKVSVKTSTESDKPDDGTVSPWLP